MVNLPDTKTEMVTSEFEGVAEALKGSWSFFPSLSPITRHLCPPCPPAA